MIKEFEIIVLSRDLPEYGLNRGDIGPVVHCYAEGKASEVEFVTGDPVKKGDRWLQKAN